MSALQLMATAIGYLMPDRLSSSVLTTVTVLVSGMVSGIPLNFADLKKIPGVQIFSTLSPTRHLILPLLQNDHSHKILEALSSNLVCHNRQVYIYHSLSMYYPCIIHGFIHDIFFRFNAKIL